MSEADESRDNADNRWREELESHVERLQRQLEIYARELQDHFLEQRRLEEALRQRIAELQRSRERIMTVEESLRKEIAELLHGRVQTKLIVAWHKMGRCEALMDGDVSQAKTLLGQIRDEIDQIREREVRQASHVLHPSIIQIGLVPAINSLISPFHEYFKITLRVSQAITTLDDPVENRIPETLRLTVYRILEESLNNVYRHAEASHVEIELDVGDAQQIHLVMTDDGRGFDISGLEMGLGLTSIADRVGVAEGEWTIDSSVGHGARLSVWLPMSSYKAGQSSEVSQGRDEGWAEVGSASGGTGRISS